MARGPFLAHLRTPVPPDRLVDVALERIRGGSTWIKLLADARGPDGNMLAATPTYPLELVAALCSAVHDDGGRVAAHTTSPTAPVLVDAGWTRSSMDGLLDTGAVARLGARGGAWTPTISTALMHLQPLIDAGHPASGMLQRHLDGLAIALSGAVASGVVVIGGTDECARGSVREGAELLHQQGLRATEAATAASHAARIPPSFVAFLGIPPSV